MQKNIKIDTEIYSEDKINNAISDFWEVADISFNNSIITISWINDLEIDEIFNELMNYVISL